MARPRKYRRVCGVPEVNKFGPLGRSSGQFPPIIMTVDEYESIRLIDFEGFTQEEAALQMDVARTTVQGMYAIARQKVAQALVKGRTLQIEGGEYLLCEDLGPGCRLNCRGEGAGRGDGAGRGEGAGRGHNRGRGRQGGK